MTSTSGSVSELATARGLAWPELERARERSSANVAKLKTLLAGQDSAETSIVAYGSLARDEWTSKSDVDWTLLVDGGVDPQHLSTAHRIESILLDAKFAKPGQTGTFGSVSFGHDIVHRIGGQDDTNQNTTRRILLLLESIPLGRADAFIRVLRHTLLRYVEDDRGLRHGTVAFVPRFLLNDIARYWRTMCVDFAQKQRERRMQGWALRNAKLRMSRKLIFASGLLICLQCETSPDAEEARRTLRSGGTADALVEYLELQLRLKPLDVVARAASQPRVQASTAQLIFEPYAEFLEILNDEDKRNHLNNLEPEAFDDDTLFKRVRKLSHNFQDGLIELFFESEPRIADLTKKYGVF